MDKTSFYFWRNGNYASYDVKDESFLKRLNDIIRIEKYFDPEFYPIWTKEDGEITQTENFVKLKGTYYTIKFLEQLIDKINEFKKINI